MSRLNLKFAAVAFCASAASAQSVSDLTQVLDRYLAAVKARNFQGIVAQYHAPAKQAVLADFTTPAERKSFVNQIAEMAPDSYKAPEIVPGGDRIVLRIMATKVVPPAIRKANKLPPVVEKAMVVDFIQESGQWKMGPPSFNVPGAAPAEATVRPKDLLMGTRSDYKEDPNTQLGGPILRLEKQTAGTVYVVRLLDEEVAAFVPEFLVQSGFEPGKIIVMQGAMHKQDSQKFWAESAKLHQP